MSGEECPFTDDFGNHMGHCNSCGEEAPLNGWPCCDSGEVEPYDEEKCEDAW